MVAEEVRGKGKRGLLRIIFGRTTFFILFMALQIAVLAWIYFWLDDRYRGVWIRRLRPGQRRPGDPDLK